MFAAAYPRETSHTSKLPFDRKLMIYETPSNNYSVNQVQIANRFDIQIP